METVLFEAYVRSMSGTINGRTYGPRLTDTVRDQRLKGSENNPIVLELHTILPNLDCSGGTGYCTTRPTNKGKNYTDWEKEIATPALVAAGYDPCWCWVTGDRDSCGPLTRTLRVYKDGLHYRVFYG